MSLQSIREEKIKNSGTKNTPNPGDDVNELEELRTTLSQLSAYVQKRARRNKKAAEQAMSDQPILTVVAAAAMGFGLAALTRTSHTSRNRSNRNRRTEQSEVFHHPMTSRPVKREVLAARLEKAADAICQLDPRIASVASLRKTRDWMSQLFSPENNQAKSQNRSNANGNVEKSARPQ